MILGGAHIFAHLFPGRASAVGAELVEGRPEQGKRSIDDGPTRIEEAKRVCLGFVGQAHIVG